MASFEKVYTTPITEVIYNTLLGKILSGELKPGDWLPPERELAEKMNVSRSSLHQAVTQLVSTGFLEIEPRKGTFVSDYRNHPTPQSLAALMSYSSIELDEPLFYDMMETRIWLETECARKACDNIYPATFSEMEDIANRLDKENVELPKLIYRYHYMLTQASGNSLYAMIFKGFEEVITNLIAWHYTLKAVDIHEAAEMHKELLEHIKNREPDKAAQCCERIITQGINVIKTKYAK